MAEIWTTNGGKDNWFFVVDERPGDPAGAKMGYGISLDHPDEKLYHRQPLHSYMNRNPYEEWAEYQGDHAPILAAFARAKVPD